MAGRASSCRRRRRRLGDSEKRVGAGRTRGRVGSAGNFSPGASARPPRRGGGGRPAGTPLPPGPESVCADPLLGPALPGPPQRACRAGRPRARLRRRGTVSVPPRGPPLSDTLRATRPGGGVGAAARTTPRLLRPRPGPPRQPAVSRRGAGGDCRRGTGRAPEWVGSRGAAGRGRGGGRRETRETRFPCRALAGRLGPPPASSPLSWGSGGRGPSPRGPGAAAGCPGWGHAGAAGVQALSGPGRRGPRGGRGGRGCGHPCSCRASPTGCTVPRRRAAPWAGSARGWSGSACVRECARRGAASARPPSIPLARRGWAALSRGRTPSPLLSSLLLLHFAISSR